MSTRGPRGQIGTHEVSGREVRAGTTAAGLEVGISRRARNVVLIVARLMRSPDNKGCHGCQSPLHDSWRSLGRTGLLVLSC